MYSTARTSPNLILSYLVRDGGDCGFGAGREALDAVRYENHYGFSCVLAELPLFSLLPPPPSPIIIRAGCLLTEILVFRVSWMA